MRFRWIAAGSFAQRWFAAVALVLLLGFYAAPATFVQAQYFNPRLFSGSLKFRF